MGLLTDGKALTWEEAQAHIAYVREHGIKQFIHNYKHYKDRRQDCLKWGEEIEYYVVYLDDEEKEAKLVLRGGEILKQLAVEAEGENCVFHPEYGRFMIESTPGKPYGASVADFLQVEGNMRRRREIAQSVLKPGEYVVTQTSFARMGVGRFCIPHSPPMGPAAQSLFITDECINEHPRFPCLTANIRKRRGSKVAINMPLFMDANTKPPRFCEEDQFFEEVVEVASSDGASVQFQTASGKLLTPLPPAALPNHIYMDCMCFGMGCCCLQMTFQAVDINEARNLYDQLNVLAPIMMALSAGAPVFRGLISDVDCRWDVISASVDDRTKEERGLEPLRNNRFVINKSRYDSIDSFLGQNDLMKDAYNDLDIVYDPAVFDELTSQGIDPLLARHIAHLYIRDPLVIMLGKVEEVDDTTMSTHFENIQSTNWQTVRFKPPPPGVTPAIGWRVEFRPTEVQTTDFENAAYSIFIVLLTRVVLTYHLNFYMPISKIDENIRVAHHRNAVMDEKFFFRKFILSSTLSEAVSMGASPSVAGSFPAGDPDENEQMSIDQIMNGNAEFPGLLPLVHAFLDSLEISISHRNKLNKYFELLRMRATGELLTTAQWMRAYITSHPAYKQDSVVTHEINYDLTRVMVDINEGTVHAPDLLGDLHPLKPDARVVRVR